MPPDFWSYQSVGKALNWAKPTGFVFDIGHGSGKQLIEAKLLGAERAMGYDILPDAYSATEVNAEANGVEVEQITSLAQLPDDKAEIIILHLGDKQLGELTKYDKITGPDTLIFYAGFHEIHMELEPQIHGKYDLIHTETVKRYPCFVLRRTHGGEGISS